MCMTRRNLKKTVQGALALAIVLVAGSCYWNPQGGAGKISLNLQSADRAQVDTVTVQYARVYLYNDNMNNRVDIGDGKPYYETTMSSKGGTATVEHVPAGSDYTLVVTLGVKDGSTFVPGQFGLSDTTFDVTAGHKTDVSVSRITTVSAELYTNDPQYALPGQNLVGVATDGSYIAAATSTVAYFLDSGLAPVGSVTPGPRINSVSFVGASSLLSAYDEFWLNTTSGIREFSVTSGPIVIQQNNLPTGPAANVLRSGAYNSGQNAVVVYYASDESFGGAFSLPVSGATWTEVRFSETANSQPVRDFVFTDGPIGYFASQVGTFAISI